MFHKITHGYFLFSLAGNSCNLLILQFPLILLKLTNCASLTNGILYIMQKIPDFLIESKNSSNLQTKSIVFQTWQKNGSCPEGTIPIRRIRTEDLSRAASLNLFGRKPIMHFMKSTNNTNSNYPIVNGSFAYVPENRTVYLYKLVY